MIDHAHRLGSHDHTRGDEPHWHVASGRKQGRTYFKHETRQGDGAPVKCEGRWSVELGVIDDWCYAPQSIETATNS